MKAGSCTVTSSAHICKDHTVENTARISVRSGCRRMPVPLFKKPEHFCTLLAPSAVLARYGPAFQTWLLLREEPGSRLSASIKRMLVFTPASRLGRLNLFLALWETTWASVKHEKQYMPPPPALALRRCRDLLGSCCPFLLKTGRSLIAASCANGEHSD